MPGVKYVHRQYEVCISVGPLQHLQLYTSNFLTLILNMSIITNKITKNNGKLPLLDFLEIDNN